jgi:hypothetical protein
MLQGAKLFRFRASFQCQLDPPPSPESAAVAIDAVEGAAEPPPLRRMLRLGLHPPSPPQQPSKRRSLHCPKHLQ